MSEPNDTDLPSYSEISLAGGAGSVSDRARRLVICALVIAVLTGTAFAAQVSSKKVVSSAAFVRPAAAGNSGIAPQDVSSTAWYCTSGMPATLVLSSRSTSVVSAVVTMAVTGKSESVLVPPGGQFQIPPPAHTSGPQGATVTLDGGGVAVSESVSSPYGWSVTQCASSSSSTWYFPQGSTIAGDTVTLDLYDPSVTQAVVDIDVVTPSGEVQPTEYQGVAVPAGGLVTEKLDAHATNDPQVATIVEAASGSVVAEELQRTTSRHVVGITEQLGAPKPQSVWGFPYCLVPRGAELTFNIVNPGSVPSRVVLQATYGRGSAVHPVTLSVPATSTASIVLNHEPGFLPSTPYAVIIRSNTAVVIGRSILRPKKPPRPNAGATLGVPIGADHWLIPTIGLPWYLTFENMGAQPVKITVTKARGGGAPVPGSSNVVLVQPGEAVGVSQSVLKAFPGNLDVDSTGPIAIELDGTPAASPGVVVVPAFVAP